jgi:uncharacterized protein YbjQ (UPF0145 family)
VADLTHELITTANDLAGYRIISYLGVVRGITVRSRSLAGTLGGAWQTIAGGNITLFTELCEESRLEAYELMFRHATERGANAIIAMRYDTTELMSGVAEVLAYGTAVVVEKAEASPRS